LSPSIKLEYRHDQITRIRDLARLKDLVNHTKSGILISRFRSSVIGMRFQFRYSRLDRNVREPVPGRAENHRVVCSNFFLSASAFALSASSSSCVRNRMSGNTESAQRGGRSWSSSQVHVWTVKDGRATVFWQYQGDQQTEDEFWSKSV
jgi:hypothetical protein